MHGTQKDDFSADINIIPLVDIMLVLLIIFMITAPFLKASLNVELPETQNLPPVQTQKNEDITIQIDSKGRIFLNGTKTSLEELQKKLLKLDRKKTVFVEADKKVRWEKVAKVLDVLQGAGFQKIALVTALK